MTGIGVSLMWLFCALFAGLEAALVTIPLARLRSGAKREARGQDAAFPKLLRNRPGLVAAARFGQASCTAVALGWLATACFSQEMRLAQWSWFALVTVLGFALAWVVPKVVFPHLPLSFLLFLTRILGGIKWPLRPLGQWISRWTVRWGWGESLSARENREAFREFTSSLVSSSASSEDGVLTQDEMEIIRRMMDFDRVTARSLMIPLGSVIAIHIQVPVSTVLNLARENEMDHFPVMGNNGRYVGWVQAFELLKVGNSVEGLEPYLRELIEVRETTSALQALQMMR
ncbi:MAG: CNNM domain-containing protein, partial [Verrucomicrobiota bacterium]